MVALTNSSIRHSSTSCITLINDLVLINAYTGVYQRLSNLLMFAWDDIFDEWNQITCNELCELYAKFSKMYIMSREESYSESKLKDFEVIIVNA